MNLFNGVKHNGQRFNLFYFVQKLILKLIDRGFELQLGQTKDYKIGNCRFFTKRTALRR